jgi:hypothetical protein
MGGDADADTNDDDDELYHDTKTETNVTARLESIERKVDELLAMLRPVSDHAAWVDGLRTTLSRLNLVSDVRRIE